MLILLRAFSSNLRTIAVGAGEQATLTKRAIADPTVQRYLVWRRSILFVVLLVTLGSAVVATVQEILPAPVAGHPLLERLEESLGITINIDPPEAAGPQTAFALFADGVDRGADFAMPAAALAALLCWSRLLPS